MKKITKWLFVAIIMVTTTAMFSQGKLTGVVNDGNGALPGASVIVKGTTVGTTTDFNGKFSLDVSTGSGTLEISFIGYKMKSVSFSVANGASKNLGTFLLETDSEALDEILIVGRGVIDLADGRKTPIAVSTIRAKDIQDKVGTKDVTEMLVNTPSVTVTGQAGGFGDTRISVRGFTDDNTAYLLNGQPINSMEDGKMFWSNWSGLADVANVIQIQRGLGSSKLAISSVGGTVNFVTKTTDKREGGYFSQGFANNGYTKSSVAYSSGVNDKGWGFTTMFTHWEGNGYNEGNFGKGETYFFSVGYTPNERHNFNFLITGAPQRHDQNFSKKISDYITYGRRYNNNWGTLKGKYITERRNFYHKPVANFNWDWTIDEETSLSTVVYASWGRGGGTGGRGRRIRKADGHIDYDAIYANNKATGGVGDFGNNAYIIRGSMNLHSWYGVVSNLSKKINDNWNYNVGVDVRLYKGTHFRQAVNLLGLDAWTEDRRIRGADHQRTGERIPVLVTDSFAANPWTATFNTFPVSQRIAWDYHENINYVGTFAQVEYANDSFSGYLQTAVSTQSHEREDRYQYLGADQQSEKINNSGFNIKGGANFKIDNNSSFYVNAGYYDRQPYHDNIFLNFTNQVNPLTSNESITGLEAGYNVELEKFTASVNVYRTQWKDRVTGNSNTDSSGNLTFTTNQSVEQLHKGFEFDFVAKPTSFLNVKGFLSVGDWAFVGDIVQTERDEELNILSESTTDVDGGKVGDAAQFTYGVGLVFKVTDDFSFDTDYRYNGQQYARRTTKFNLKLPDYEVIDVGMSYRFKIKGNDRKTLNFRLNINNFMNEIYIAELTSANFAADGDDTFNGIKTNNRGHFGLGRTWSFSMKYKF